MQKMENKKIQKSVNLNINDMAWVVEYCKKNGDTVSEILRFWIKEKIEQLKNNEN